MPLYECRLLCSAALFLFSFCHITNGKSSISYPSEEAALKLGKQNRRVAQLRKRLKGDPSPLFCFEERFVGFRLDGACQLRRLLRSGGL